MKFWELMKKFIEDHCFCLWWWAQSHNRSRFWWFEHEEGMSEDKLLPESHEYKLAPTSVSHHLQIWDADDLKKSLIPFSTGLHSCLALDSKDAGGRHGGAGDPNKLGPQISHNAHKLQRCLELFNLRIIVAAALLISPGFHIILSFVNCNLEPHWKGNSGKCSFSSAGSIQYKTTLLNNTYILCKFVFAPLWGSPLLQSCAECFQVGKVLTSSVSTWR